MSGLDPNTPTPILRILNPYLNPIKHSGRNNTQHPSSEFPFMWFYASDAGAALGAGVTSELRGGGVGFQVGEVRGRDGSGHDGEGGEELAGDVAAGVAEADGGF